MQTPLSASTASIASIVSTGTTMEMRVTTKEQGVRALRPQRTLRGRRGSALVAAMTALVVALILVLGMFAAGVRTLGAGKHEAQTGASRMAAEAGIEYAYCQYVYNSGTPPPYATILPRTYNHSFCCGPGGFAVTITDNTANVIGTVNVVSTGTVNGDSTTITRVIPKPKTVFDYACACSVPAVDSYFPIITGTGGQNGDLRANGPIQLNAAGSKINGDAVSTSTITNTTVTGNNLTSAAKLPFPEVNTTYYAGIADRTFATSQTWSGFTFLKPYEVVYVNGDVTLKSGLYSGRGTIVCGGVFHLQGKHGLCGAHGQDRASGSWRRHRHDRHLHSGRFLLRPQLL